MQAGNASTSILYHIIRKKCNPISIFIIFLRRQNLVYAVYCVSLKKTDFYAKLKKKTFKGI